MSAKSEPTSSASSNSTGRIAVLCTTNVSCIASSPTNRSRRIDNSSRSSAPASGLRMKNAAEKYSIRPDESSNGRLPLMVMFNEERKRVSSANSPSTSAPKSPRSSQMQNVAPSRIRNCSAMRHSRIIRAPDDCARALTTSSSTFTCGGRVTAKRTHSAMSSGLIASTPS